MKTYKPSQLPTNFGGTNHKIGEQKQLLVLQFLASGEVFSDFKNIQNLLETSESSAERTINSLLKKGDLTKEFHFLKGHKKTIVGCTPAGCSRAGCNDSHRLQTGRINSNFISHHLQVQEIRLKALKGGFSKWTPGRLLYNKKLKKIPDALALSKSGQRVAIEVEKTIKTQKRYQEILQALNRPRTTRHLSA